MADILEDDVTYAPPNACVCCLGNGEKCTNALLAFSPHSQGKAVVDTPAMRCVYKAEEIPLLPDFYHQR